MWKKGLASEEFVAERLLQRGWTLLARDLRYPGSEIDLIALRESRLLFIEVKSRKAIDDPSALLPPRKLQSLARGIQIWLTRNEGHYPQVEAWLCCVETQRKEPKWEWFDITPQIEAACDGS